MNTRLKLFTLFALLVGLLTAPLTASAQVRPGLPTIVEIAAGDDRFETLVTAVSAAGLVDTLNGPGPFTVFAPTDDAFAKLPSAVLNAALADPNGLLTDVLLYHVVSGDVGSEIVLTLDSATTVGGEKVHIKRATVNGQLRVYLNDEVQVIITDIVASNGVIHVIDTVLLPPSLSASAPAPLAAVTNAVLTSNFVRPTLPTIVEIAAGDSRFNTLVTAVTAADLVNTLSGPGPFTVFAPTNDAFAKLPSATLQAALADPKGLLTQVLLYHVVSGDVGSEIVLTLNSATTVGGEKVNIKFFNGSVYLNDNVKVTITDIIASNGVIHVIDTVLLPPSIVGATPAPAMTTAATPSYLRPNLPNIVEIAAGDSRFSTLVTAVSAAGLAETLSGPGPFTVFAPTNDAFAKLPAGTLEAVLADPKGLLTDILLYHVVSGDVGSEIVMTLDSATTVGGEKVTIKRVNIDGQLRVYLNDEVQVIITDIVASNGVIHVIDTVLLPPAGN